jgi:hypothetical protein
MTRPATITPCRHPALDAGSRFSPDTALEISGTPDQVRGDVGSSASVAQELLGISLEGSVG